MRIEYASKTIHGIGRRGFLASAGTATLASLFPTARTNGARIVFMHLRDQYKDGGWSESLGEGDMDYSSIAVALRDISFSGDAVIELAHEQDFKPTRPLGENIRLSRSFVRTTLGF